MSTLSPEVWGAGKHDDHDGGRQAAPLMADDLGPGLRTARDRRPATAAPPGAGRALPPRPPRYGPLPRARTDALHRAVSVAALLVVVLLLLMAVRLPWVGDLGMHAAVIERLRADPLHPGNPLVHADTPSPYYSPWMLAFALLAKAAGWSAFPVLHLAALADLALLLTGIRCFVRTFTARRSAVPLAVLTVTLLYGVHLFAWSGLVGLTSLSLTLAYPSTFALGLSFHLWALLRTALAHRWRLPAFCCLGLLLSVILLSHPFTGAVALFGAAGMALGARPWPPRPVWIRLGAATALALAILALWPYYGFFSLVTAGGLEEVHRSLYRDLFARFCLLPAGIAALAVRARRERRDPLVLFFLLGLTAFTLGGLTGHHSWGRTLPAVLLPAQVALALEACGAGGRAAGRVFAPLTAAALLTGAWTQAGSLAYVLRTDAIPPVLRGAPRIAPWPAFSHLARSVPPGQTVMTNDYYALRTFPAYGPYTVASAYPDAFLPDQQARRTATARYFAPGTSRQERMAILREYGASWVVHKARGPGLPPVDPALTEVARGPHGLVLLKVGRR